MARRVTRASRGIRLPKAEQIPYELPSVQDRVVYGGTAGPRGDLGIARMPPEGMAELPQYPTGLAPRDYVYDERGGLPLAPFVEGEPIVPSLKALLQGLRGRRQRRVPREDVI
jgi:hypothetical protein